MTYRIRTNCPAAVSGYGSMRVSFGEAFKSACLYYSILRKAGKLACFYYASFDEGKEASRNGCECPVHKRLVPVHKRTSPVHKMTIPVHKMSSPAHKMTDDYEGYICPAVRG